MLRAQDKMKWTIISTGIFTSFLFQPVFGVVDLEERTVRALGGWENEFTVTSAEDIGKLTARIVLDVKESGGKGWDGVVKIAGDTKTFRDVVSIVRRLVGEMEEEVLSVQELERRYREDSDDVGLKYQLIWARNKGVSWSVEESWNGKRGIKVESLEEWVEKNLSKPS